METPIQLEAVWKSYAKVPAVSDLTLRVPTGSVYGFLGPNGAGKSTTIRLILGLQRPDRGTISLFGHGQANDRLESLRRIGSMVETPSCYFHLTGRENLEIYRRLLRLRKLAIDEALETVDLTYAADMLVRKYSSGMKQRLGLAQAFLGDPEVLILDEPTNGLDPAGIHEVRNLVRDLPKRRGVTVFLSSHLLSEVEQTATHLAIISNGKLMFEGRREQLQARSQSVTVVVVDQPDGATSVLHELGCSLTRTNNTLRVLSSPVPTAELNAALVRAGINVSQLVTQHPTLEEFFLEVTAPESEKGQAVP